MSQENYYQQNESRNKVGHKHSVGSGKLKIERIGGNKNIVLMNQAWLFLRN